MLSWRALLRVLNGTAPPDVSLYVLANLVIRWGVFGLVARKMLGVIRADGGTPAEFLVYLWYTAALLAGIAWGVLVLFAVLRTLGDERLARAGLTGAEVLVWLGSGAEILTFSLMGLHPYGATTWAAVGTADFRSLPWWFLAGVGVVVGGFAVGEWLLLRGATRLARHLPGGGAWDRGIGGRLMAYALVGMAAFVAIDRDDAERLVPRGALPLYSVWREPTRQFPDLHPRRRIGDPLQAPTLVRRPDIVVVMLESLRWDMLTPAVMPMVSRFATEHGCLVPPRHYAGGHLTQYGTFSLLYGLGAWAFLPYMQEARPSWPLAALRANGYKLYAFDATGVNSYGINPLVPGQFDRYETKLTADSVMVDETVHALSLPGPLRPRFLFTFLYGTHGGYFSPSDFEPDWPPADLTGSHPGLWTRYLRSARYLDHLLGRLTAQVGDRLRAGSLVLVIAGDHGEEFWEFGLGGHAAVRFQDVRTRVPLVLCLPGTAGPAPALSEQADVFPTILAWAGGGAPPAGAMSGRSLLDRPDSVPVALAGSGFPERDGRFALVTSHAKFWLTLEEPTFRGIKLDRVTDLNDHPLPESDSLRIALRAALDAFERELGAVLRRD